MSDLKQIPSGTVFHYWTVIEEDVFDPKMFLCECKCGVKKYLRGALLRAGQTKSCGCYHREVITTHGHSARSGTKKITREYTTHHAMVMRCTIPTHQSWKDYGGRGIRVCKYFLVFENYLSDTGVKPEKTELDRIDNEAHYSCGHCDDCVGNGWKKNWQWSTRKQNDRHRRSSKYLEFNGKRQTYVEWAEETGFTLNMIVKRVRMGWSTHRILTTPPDYSNKPHLQQKVVASTSSTQ